MTDIVPRRVREEDLMRFLDGESTPEERAAVEAWLEESSELRREAAIYRAIRRDMRDLSFAAPPGGTVWHRIRTRISVPVGWILCGGGLTAWIAYAAWAFARAPTGLFAKLATGGIAIGVLVLLAYVILDRARTYASDPYRDVRR